MIKHNNNTNVNILVFKHQLIFQELIQNDFQCEHCTKTTLLQNKIKKNAYDYIILSDEKIIQDSINTKAPLASRLQWIILTPTPKLKKYSLQNIKRIDAKLNEKKLFEKIKKYIKKTTHQRYQELLENYKAIVDESAIVSQTDKNGIITYVNDNFSKISGYSKEELLGHSHNLIRHPDVSSFFFKDLWHTLKAQKEWKGLLKNKNRKGQTYYLKTHIKPLLDKHHKTKGYISIRNEITDVLDPKETLMDDIKNLKKPMLVMVKIEEFNELEEYYTIQIIRNIEQVFSQSLLNFFPKNSGYKKVYALRNGEFALLKSFDNKVYDESKEVLLLEEFQNNVKASCINYDKYDFNLNVILSYDIGSKNIFENVRLGIKQAQKNKLNIINAKNLKRESKKHIIANLKTLKMIKDAVENHRIKTYYQPISCNKCDKIVKYESLARIVKENGVVIRPIHFIDAAKRMKYYTQITDTMIDNIFFAMREYQKKITLNLSSYDIEDNRIREKIIDMIFEYNMAHKLTIELLEDEESKDFTKVKNFITIVKKMGVKIAIDDFGSGYSNFNRLMQFEPDILKIDGSIIRNIDTNVYNKHIVDTIINFASKEKIKTVAEFVYNKEIFDIVKDMGVDYSQGYYIGEPKPYFLD